MSFNTLLFSSCISSRTRRCRACVHGCISLDMPSNTLCISNPRGFKKVDCLLFSLKSCIVVESCQLGPKNLKFALIKQGAIKYEMDNIFTWMFLTFVFYSCSFSRVWSSGSSSSTGCPEKQSMCILNSKNALTWLHLFSNNQTHWKQKCIDDLYEMLIANHRHLGWWVVTAIVCPKTFGPQGASNWGT